MIIMMMNNNGENGEFKDDDSMIVLVANLCVFVRANSFSHSFPSPFSSSSSSSSIVAEEFQAVAVARGNALQFPLSLVDFCSLLPRAANGNGATSAALARIGQRRAHSPFGVVSPHSPSKCTQCGISPLGAMQKHAHAFLHQHHHHHRRPVEPQNFKVLIITIPFNLKLSPQN